MMNTTLYPSNEDFQRVTEEFLSIEYPDYLKKTKKDKWVATYEKNFYPLVSLKNTSAAFIVVSKLILFSN